MQITGTIVMARPVLTLGGGAIISGHLYGDIRQRWIDGMSITTSSVRALQDDIAITRNSAYRLVWARGVEGDIEELKGLLKTHA